jgi:hypothetical protein
VLPESTAHAQKGTANQEPTIYHMTDQYYFEGYAWYSRKLLVEESWENKKLTLFLERTRISTVYVDGEEINTEDSTEDRYDNPATNPDLFITGKNYVNSTNYSLLLSYEELINYDVIWKGFPYNFQPENADNNLYQTEQATDIVDGYGANNWILKENHSPVIGISNDKTSITTITQSFFTTASTTRYWIY